MMGDNAANVETVVSAADAVVPLVDAEAHPAWVDFDIEVNLNHPLYLHPSNNPCMSSIFTKLSGPENYAMWSRAMIVTFLGIRLVL